MSLRDLIRESAENPQQHPAPVEPTRTAVMIFGSGPALESLTLRDDLNIYVFPGTGFEDLELGTQQMAFAHQELQAKDIENAMKLYLLDGVHIGDATQQAMAESITKDPLNSVAIIAPEADDEHEARQKLETSITDTGAVVVDNLEDAVDYASHRLI